MGFLKRLFGGQPAQAPEPQPRVDDTVEKAPNERHATPPFVNNRGPVPTDGVKLRGKGRVGVSGERNYLPALVAITGGRTQDGVNIGVLAALVPEPGNPHDPKAVAVRVDGQTVGYLSRTDARAYGKVLATLAAAGKTGYCNATIRGGWDRGRGDTGDFGVSLDLGPPDVVLKED